MKLSWSHKLFLRINEQVGKRRWLDFLMIFCAKWLIYVMGIVFAYGLMTLSTADWLPAVLAILIGYGFSLLIGLVWPHRRPVSELPNVKTLVKTITTWKSFPSDHTYFSFIMTYCFYLLIGAHQLVWVLYIFAAVLVAISRIYAGVHYPRDIIGGLALAIIVVPIFHYILFVISYLLYFEHI